MAYMLYGSIAFIPHVRLRSRDETRHRLPHRLIQSRIHTYGPQRPWDESLRITVILRIIAHQLSSGVTNVRDRERTACRKNQHEQGEQTHARTKRAHDVAFHAVEVQHIDGARLGHVRGKAADG